MATQEAIVHLMSNDDPESQQDVDLVEVQGREARWRALAAPLVKVGVVIGLVVALAGSALVGGRVFGGSGAAAAELRGAMAEFQEAGKRSAKDGSLESQQCHWLKMEQHDFPERGDMKSVEYKGFKDVSEVERYAEDNGFAGFALRENVAYLKGGENSPNSWRDLLWMGEEYKVDFYLCEKPELWRETAAQVQQALEVLDGYVSTNTAHVKMATGWVIVHGIPENEGAGIGFDFQSEASTIEDIKVLCAAEPDCVGFAYDPKGKEFYAKKKNTGFVAATAKYHDKVDPNWQLGASGMNCDVVCQKADMKCITNAGTQHSVDVVNTTGMNDIMEDFGVACTSFDTHGGGPSFDPSTGECTLPAASRATYSCSGLPSAPSMRRLCLCAESFWEWYYIESRAVVPGADEAYTKIELKKK